MSDPVAKARILFVDDDVEILDGMRRSLTKCRSRWDMVFVSGGPGGLAEVERSTFDVVVSDMRMPEVDGIALLGQVRDRDPSTIRIVLSGYSEHRAHLQAPPIAHHFLDKPCESKQLIRVLDSACEVRALFASEPLRTVVVRFAKLPSPLINAAFARYMEQDSVLSAGIVTFASSALFAFEQPVTSVPEAISRIGLDVIARLGLTTGLVRDIGKIVIAITMPEQHDTIVRRLDEPAATRSSLERELLGTTHHEVGAYVLALWGMPLSMIEAVAHALDASDSQPIPCATRLAIGS